MQVLKSPNDRRSFRYVKLPNDLEVLLISDSQTEKSAASLSISVGSFQDTIEGIGIFWNICSLWEVLNILMKMLTVHV